MLKIYIPTIGRINKQLTISRFPQELAIHTYLVTSKAEAADLQKANPQVKVLACAEKGIVKTRDWILAHAVKNKHRKLVMLDDDLDIQRRREDMRITTVYDEAEYIEAFDWIDQTLNDYAHCGWGTRFLAYANPAEFFSPGRMMYCLAYDVKKVVNAGASFGQGLGVDGTMEDFNITLQLLTQGYANKVSLEWRASPRGTNAAGGCSTWRTTKGANASAASLVKRFPGLVKMRPRKNVWEGMDEGLMDVTVQWKKALRTA
jgi:hypothetical protein